MKLAIIGSRGLWVEDLGAYLPPGVTELVSGGAKGIGKSPGTKYVIDQCKKQKKTVTVHLL